MAADFPYLYPYTRAEAERRGEAWMHEDSFLQNVCCARDIEQAIRSYFDESSESLRKDCAQAVLERYGFKRVRYVLANSLQEVGCRYLHSESNGVKSRG